MVHRHTPTVSSHLQSRISGCTAQPPASHSTTVLTLTPHWCSLSEKCLSTTFLSIQHHMRNCSAKFAVSCLEDHGNATEPSTHRCFDHLKIFLQLLNLPFLFLHHHFFISIVVVLVHLEAFRTLLDLRLKCVTNTRRCLHVSLPHSLPHFCFLPG